MPEPVKPEKLLYSQIQSLFSVAEDKEMLVTRQFLAGDHWQKQDGWIGWRPATDSATAVQDWMIIEKGFTPKNVIRGMVRRIVGAILGKEPDWDVVAAEVGSKSDSGSPPVKQDPKFDEMDTMLTRWWTDKRIHEKLKDFIWNKAAYGRAAIRIFIPIGYLETNPDGTIILKVADLAEALDLIYVDAPNPESVAFDHDPYYGDLYTALAQRLLVPGSLIQYSENIVYEMCYIDQDGLTHLRHVRADGENNVSVDLGGNLLTFVDGLVEEALISPTVKAQQRQLNHANTMEGYSMANINFPPTYFTNAVTDVETVDITGKKTMKKTGLLAGFAQYVNLIGQSLMHSDGSEGLATPTITFQPTGKPEDFAKVAQNKSRDMHEEAGMLYVYLADNPYPSGNSRIEAMTDYLILLADYKTLCDKLGTWLLETVLRLGLSFTDQADLAEKFNITFSSKVTAGRVAPEDKKVMIQEVQDGLRSKRNYMVTTEVTDDPDSELLIIKADPSLPAPGVKALAPPAGPQPPSPAPAPTNGGKPAPAPAAQ